MREESRIRFISYKIDSIHFEINRDYVGEDQEDENLSINLTRSWAVHKENPGDFIVTMLCEINQREEDSDSEMPFSLDISLLGHFVAEQVEPSDLEVFAKYNAPSILYPYLRAAVSQVVTMAGFDPVLLPIVNFRNEDE
ncbi:protein-export chaperone SecB [Tumebacillus flagellatus]|uniref:Preprotein translocase subunit SecB n=1 Tax=Tumebacillus flagellatus TaxID=1157490 RepID=A0A074LR97_9BACL|nr:protein-export chaperone SecB [Tumebacillus flagellatus]KEO84626.1 hypothetical protein EL26_03670 [Tumebacillus flagellatus]